MKILVITYMRDNSHELKDGFTIERNYWRSDEEGIYNIILIGSTIINNMKLNQ